MKLTKTRRPPSIAFNMTPMIDIVFLLIIFFMTVSQITRTVDHPVALPVVGRGSAESSPATVTINLDRAGNILVAGRQLTLDNCMNAIGRRVEEKNADVSQIKIHIRCDRDCESKHVNRLIERLSKLGFTQVQVAVSDE